MIELRSPFERKEAYTPRLLVEFSVNQLAPPYGIHHSPDPDRQASASQVKYQSMAARRTNLQVESHLVNCEGDGVSTAPGTDQPENGPKRG